MASNIQVETGAKVLMNVLEELCEALTGGMRALLYTNLKDKMNPHAMMVVQFLKAKYPENCLTLDTKTPCLDTFMITHTFLSLYKIGYDGGDEFLMKGTVQMLLRAVSVMMKRDDEVRFIGEDLRNFFGDMEDMNEI